MGILPLVSRLSCPLYLGTRLAASRDKYNILLLNLSDSQPASVFRYISLYYFNSILLLIVLSTTSAPIPFTITTLCALFCNPASFATVTATNVLTLEQWEVDFTNIRGVNTTVREYSWVG